MVLWRCNGEQHLRTPLVGKAHNFMLYTLGCRIGHGLHVLRQAVVGDVLLAYLVVNHIFWFRNGRIVLHTIGQVISKVLRTGCKRKGQSKEKEKLLEHNKTWLSYEIMERRLRNNS